MPRTSRRAERKTLTRQRVVEAAAQLLDTVGEDGLTFRALAAKLETGHGAIQWHVATKDELLVAATEMVVSRALGRADPAGSPQAAIRAVALGVFDAIEAHPWVGAQLARPPWDATALVVFELIGRQVQALEVPSDAQFTATSALLVHIIGAGSQQARNARSPEAALGRQEFLDRLAVRWEELDGEQYAFTRTVAGRMRDHDDRAELLAGIDLILAGLTRLP
ncbi:Transcriptional regulator, TetR family [Pseudonocardia sp. Ae717_Ps2]|uniref:TetR/AcrR family transcriptional regulator n=1 Tax=Pseudonocardia sp. Ae717_Ps2 TaxID=1885573 RepID=UPI00094B7079|nr:TetR family transcriptional regulator [Pseudonocardia sp. Ae717_Ps2]OLM31363.1 Transcriptional regulator, TetR family [Pseudonocardia sp. Ae717_Ps2]